MTATQQNVSGSAAETKPVVEKFFAALNAGDAETAFDLFADDATWTIWGDFPFSGEHVGKKAILEDFLAVANQVFEPGAPELDVQHLFGEGHLVVAEYIARLKTKTGNDYENHYCLTFEVEDGAIHCVREYFDPIYFRKATH